MMLYHSLLAVACFTHGIGAAPGKIVRDWTSGYPTGPVSSAPSQWGTWQYSSASSAKNPYASSKSSATVPITITSSASVASSASTASSAASSASPNPCSSVAQLYKVAIAASPKATPTVPAQLAYECLNTIPFNQSAAIAYLDSIDPYIQWQTTLAYLADPPADYAALVQQPYDFNATWAAIHANTSAGLYQNEYEFGWAVYRAAQLAHDGHFVFYPDSVTKIFTFGRTIPLVSASIDGKSAPQPYLYTDVLANVGAGTPISAITKIDGQDAVSYLLVWSEYGSLQDPDALYNNLFWEPAQVALGSQGTGTGTFSGGGRGRLPYPGANTTLTFANGTQATYPNFARVLQPFSNVTSGANVYGQFLEPPPEAYQNPFQFAMSSLTPTSTISTTMPPATSASSTTTAIPEPGYPTPVVQEMNNLNAGYFLEGPGYDDVAVLVMRSFVGTEADEIAFQAVNTYFIETAAAMGKTKLIVDVSANGGGTILQGYDVFKQLFPSLDPYGANRFRYHDAFNILGEQDSYISGLVPRSLDLPYIYQDIVSSAFNYRTDVDVNGNNFPSWPAKAGPDFLGPDSPPESYSSLFRWNLSDVLTPLNSGGINITGYTGRMNITQQPFAAENIVILTDGYCASTCTIFAELMTQQGGVRTVTLGGRPNGNKAMQAIGGVKGTNDYPFDFIFDSIAETWNASNASTRAYLETTVLKNYSLLPLYRGTAAVVNARNGYLPGSDTPLQFVVQEADCRILYTPQMTIDETATWKTVADSAFGGPNSCVAGAMAKKSKRSAGAGVHQARSISALDMEAYIASLDVQTEGWSKRGGDSIMIP